IVDWLAGELIDKVRVYVVKYLAGKAVDFARNRIDDKVVPGLIRLDSDDPDTWTFDRSGAVTLPAMQKGRLLLVLHGTFSSTLGSFGALGMTRWGKDFLTAARQRYDGLFGFDHSTLGETPEENAASVYDALKTLAPPPGTEIDVLAFSRGGLVARLLIERLLPSGDLPVVAGKAVFVGCTNGGTALADPKNWKTFLDLYTNLAVAAGRGLEVLDAGTASTIVTQSVKTLGGFVQAVVDTTIEDRMVPGIAAMAPNSPLVLGLNGPQSALPLPNVRYFALGSDFEPTLFSGGGTDTGLPGFPVRALQSIADFGVDQLMQEHNDLVVDTEAMTQFGPLADRLVDTAMKPENALIYHTNYFENEDVVRTVGAWLNEEIRTGAVPSAPSLPSPPPPSLRDVMPDVSGAEIDWLDTPVRRGDDPTPAPRTSESDGGTGIGARRSDPFPEASDFEDLLSEDVDIIKSPAERVLGEEGDEEEAAPPPSAGSDPAAETEVRCHFGAEMDETAPLGQDVELTVTVSREEIGLVAGPGAAEGSGVARTDQPITLEVHARANCEVVSEAETDVRIPDAGHPEHYDFRIRGIKAGPAEIHVDARQGPRRLTRLVLQPSFVALGAKARAGGLAISTQPEKASVEVRIIEDSTATGQLRLRYIMQSRDLPFGQRNEVREVGRAKEAVIADFYERIEGEWGRSTSEFASFIGEIESYGAMMYDELVPDVIKQEIWKYKDQIGSIEVISQEPSIPWEILHIIDDTHSIAPGSRFLGELGLVRWVDNFYWPPATLKVRPGNARYVIPDYANPRLKLRGAAREADLLVDRFGASAIPATRQDVVAALGGESSIDLLHFACHGQATADAIWKAALLMTGEKRPDNSFSTDSVSINDVRYRARLKSDDGAMPIVFVNACQAAATGTTLTGTGGLAETFVDRGAGLFISTLWSVGDDTALTFAQVFYDALLAAKTVTEATRDARLAAKEAREPTWLAYSVYGHPYARVQVEGG
ncbi:MAG: CHAT domain-containing protein, partial [Pseudomonadota bacterium]